MMSAIDAHEIVDTASHKYFLLNSRASAAIRRKKREAKSREKAGRSRPAFNSSGLSLAEEKQCIPRKPVVAAKKASRLSDPDRCGSSYDPLEEGD
jgi:hypothetical protein